MDINLYLAVSTYLVDGDRVLGALVEHRAWSKTNYENGTLLFSGRQDPPVGGVLAFRAADRAAADAFVESDPFVREGIAEYQILAVTPTPAPWRSPGFELFASGN